MSNDSNQAKLLDHSQRQDQEVVSKLAEVDMIVADLERANSRVATVERRNVSRVARCYFPKRLCITLQEILRAEIETLRGGSEDSEQYVSSASLYKLLFIIEM